MRIKTLATAMAVSGAVFLAGSARAQTASTTPEATSASQDNRVTVPGVCLLSREALLANSAVGKSVVEQLKKLGEQAEWEIAGERKPLEDEARKLEGQSGSLAADEHEHQRQALAGRWQTLQNKAQLRSRELESTQAKALERVFQEAQPLLDAAYQQHRCGLLLDRNVVLAGDMSGDLTEVVVRSLDAKIKTFTVQRETLPESAAASSTK